jgi:type I restriction enzyme S subunit
MKSAVAIFKEGDVLYGRLRPYLNKVARPSFSGVASAEFIVLPGNENIDPAFMHLLLMQPAFVEFASHINQGDRPRVDFGQISAFTFSLPTISQQRLITLKLERLLARSATAREELARVPRLVERCKEAVLKTAFTEAEAGGAEVTTLGQLAQEVRNGASRKPENAPPGVPILRISAVRPMVVRMNERRYYNADGNEDVSRYVLQAGDLLFTRYNGNPDLVANCGMVRELDERLIYPDKLIRVRIDCQLADPTFIEAICASPQARLALTPFIKSAAGQHGISGTDLKKLLIPLPPMKSSCRSLTASGMHSRRLMG